jgi:outer membrane lipoprotein
METTTKSRALNPSSFHTLFANSARLLALGVVVLVAGCATSPVSKEMRQAAKSQPPFDLVKANPAAYKGRPVILGGIIVKTANLPKMTEVEILQRPLSSYNDRPADTDLSQGRFLARCPGFLDSAVYTEGREVTVSGTVAGQETRALDQTQYPYPVIACSSIYLWPNRPPPAYYYYPPYGYGPWGYGWGGYPYWYPYW